jgi:TolB-like protein/Tfp pilus assembly protein PilF
VNFLYELRRRNVVRVGMAYLVVSWVLLQVADVVQPILQLPDWSARLVFLLLAIGFVPVLLFAWAFELTPDGIKRESEVDRSKSITRQTGRKLNYVIVGSLVVAVMLLLVERQARMPVPSLEPAADEAAEVVRTAPDLSIAVLPFTNMSSDPEQEHFSDGITEEILNVLAAVKELKVAGRTSSFAFKGQNDDLRRIGDSLGVEHILEGSVRKSGDTVRITAQLIKVDDGFHVWSETYQRKLTDVFAIQDDIARKILEQLRVTLLNEDAAVASVTRTSPEVYDLYLRARERMYTRQRAEIETALEELDRALDLDPQYAPAYAQRGIASMLLADTQYGDTPRAESNRIGKRYIDMALKLDDNLSEAWAALGLYETRESRSDPDAAIDALAKALELNPSNIDAGNWLQIALNQVGDFAGSKRVLKELVDRDPLYRPAFVNAIVAMLAFGEFDQAEALIRRVETAEPDNPSVLTAKAVYSLLQGRSADASRLMKDRRAQGDLSGADHQYSLLSLMFTAQYEQALSELPVYMRALPLHALGRTDEALSIGRAGAESGFPIDYFWLLLREQRESDLVAFFEERWPNVRAFAAETPGSALGWFSMISLGVAYKRTGGQQTLNEITTLLEEWQARLAEQGVDNLPALVTRASLFALKDDADAAVQLLEYAAARGFHYDRPLVLAAPAFEFIADDPRLPEIQEKMRGMLNEQRAILDLPPLDENFEAVEAEG